MCDWKNSLLLPKYKIGRDFKNSHSSPPQIHLFELRAALLSSHLSADSPPLTHKAMRMRTAQRNNNLDKSYRYNCITAHGGNAGGTRIRCFSLVWPSTGTGRWCSPRGSGGSAAWGTSGMSKLAMLRRPAPEPPAAGRTFSARRPVSEQGSDSGFGWTDRGEVGQTLVGQNGIRCGQGFAKMRSGWPAGWWNGARKIWDFPHLWGFLTFTKVLPCYTSIWSEKKACVTWKRLIFQWNKDSRNILLRQPCCALTSPPVGTGAPPTHASSPWE